MILDIIVIVSPDTTRLYLPYVLFAHMLRTFTLADFVTCEFLWSTVWIYLRV